MEERVCIFLFPLSSDLHMESFFLFPFSFLALYKQINTITSFSVHTSDIALFSIIAHRCFYLVAPSHAVSLHYFCIPAC